MSRLKVLERIRAHARQLSKDASAPGPAKPILFCGPCQLETRDHALFLAESIKSICNKSGVFDFVFKASFDKANRTRGDSARGIGMERAIPIFQEIQGSLDVPVMTDIHLPQDPELLGDSVDVLQIPAFLCRQTDLLHEAGKSGKIVNIKKGQFVHPIDMKFAVEKVVSANVNACALLCERGSCFGYRDLIVDMRGLLQMRSLGYPVIFDGSHVVQNMSGKDGVSGGNSSYSAPLCRAAVAVGVDGLFIETHENPRNAPSDSDSMLPLSELSALLTSLEKIRTALAI